jgi:VanZ family protein
VSDTVSASTRWYPPIAWSALLLAVAPFMGKVQQELRTWLGQSFRWILVAGLIAVSIGCLVWAGSRIREHRLARWSGLALVIALVGAQLAFFRRQDSHADLVEKIHIVEYGLLAFLVYRAVRPAGDRRQVFLPLLWVTAVGTMDEWLQWLAPTRVGEWLDVLLNVFAGVVGLIFALAWSPPFRLGAVEARRLSRSWLAAAGTVLLFASFFHQAHLGYRITQAGSIDFLSWHSSDRLVELSRARNLAWASKAPGPLPWVGIEDFYRSEAAFHVQFRNTSLKHGDFRTAWKENEILETYFEPFLLYRGGHRWPKGKRKRIENRLELPGPAYSSPVLVGRVFTRPAKAVFWGLAGTLILGLAGASLRAARGQVERRI